MIRTITSKSNQIVKDAFALKGKGGDLFLIEGFHLCEMAFKAGCLEKVFFEKETPFDGVECFQVTREIIEKLSLAKTPEGIVGIARKPSPKGGFGDKLLVLDRVQDPGNVGTIIRTALAFGFKDVVLTKGSCSPFNPKAIASSQGSIFDLNILVDADEKALLADLRKEGRSLIATGLGRSIPSDELRKPEGKFALFLGNEGAGMSSYLLENCDIVVRIPINGIDSLNVAIAGGIMMNILK